MTDQINSSDNPVKFTPEIYEKLPFVLKDGCEILQDPIEKAVFLASAFGVISGMLPNIFGIYDGKRVYPNLFVFIVAPYGSGKGSMTFAKQLCLPIHKEKLEITIQAKKDFELELDFYETEMKAWKKSKIGQPPKRPQEPNQLLHIIPANNSQSGFFELLDGNSGAGTMFETEGDTMAENNKKENMNYSDGLRKGFHHEAFNFFRRQNKEFVEVEEPKLSVILSSTFDQLLSLIPTAENGLFSRFLYYTLDPNPRFKNVFDPAKNQYRDKFIELGERMSEAYKFFKHDFSEHEFMFTVNQKERFQQFFQDLKTKIQEEITNDLDGTVNRLGLQFFRIAMILTTLRMYEEGSIKADLLCSDSDFQLSIEIIKPFISHAIEVYQKLPAPKHFDNKYLNKAELIKQAIELHGAGLTFDKISQEIFNDKNHKSTIYRWVKNQ